jgi:hypothetical protein
MSKLFLEGDNGEYKIPYAQHPQAIRSNLLAAVGEIHKQAIDSAPERLGTLACQVYAGQMDSRFSRIALECTERAITSTLGDDVIREVIVSTSWDEEESARKGRETMLD